MGSVTPQKEYPPAASLAADIYRPFPRLPANVPAEVDPAALVTAALQSLARAGDAEQAETRFLRSQAYWRDLLALTWHLRTLNDAPAIAPALVELRRRRGWDGRFELDEGSARDVAVGPALRWVEGRFTFETSSPAAKCGGNVQLFPEEGPDGDIVWKIWVLSTWIDGLKDFPEDVAGLKAPGRNLEDEQTIETDVFILGGGNSGLIISARLKALGVESVVVDRNPRPGDNWGLRYDCLRFHIGRHSCETPYLRYPSHLPVILTRDDLSEHMRNYAAAFHLNMLNSSSVEGSSFNPASGTWTVLVRTPWGDKVIKAKHLVQATGIGGSKPFVPNIPGAESYKGISIHSAEYKNPRTLSDKGAKSVIIVGSANSAFDVMEDCALAGLQTTMVARSPTYIFPWDYALDPNGLGLYERLDTDLVDKMLMTGPASINGQLVLGSYRALASKHPDRYKPLAKAGFPVYDSLGDAKGGLMVHLMERGGGHFNDIGEGIELIVNGTVKVVANTHPVAYTQGGLEFSDGRTVDADAIVWCTGFKDKDRSITAEVLGGNKFVANETGTEAVLGPEDIATRRDAVWGVDKEGELRGVFKRHSQVDNYWIHGGTSAMHRFYALHVALQIKAAIEGILPEAYRDTPVRL